MPKSKIIADIINDKVDLSTALSRLQVIAYDINNLELAKWAEKENIGYSEDDNIPFYRKTKSIQFVYSGFNNQVYTVKNANLDIHLFDLETLDLISQVSFTQSIDGLLMYLDQNETILYLDRSNFAQEINKNSNGKIQCTSIRQIISISTIRDALSQVKNRMIKALILLEKEYGNLDKLDIDVSKKPNSQVSRLNERINEIVLNIKIDSEYSNTESTPKKICWNIIIPIITGVSGAVLSALIIKLLNM